jgi:hypothetical protein
MAKNYNEIRLHRALEDNNKNILTPLEFINLYLIS